MLELQIPQIIYICLVVIGLFQLGKSNYRDKLFVPYNFFRQLGTIILMFGLYYWGGFFDTVGNPQYLMFAFMGQSVLGHAIFHGKPRTSKFATSRIMSILASVINIYILTSGGFFGQF